MGLREKIKPFPEKKTKIYATITNINKINDDELLVTLDLVNDEVIKLDEELYSNQSIGDSKNYLFTYFMTIQAEFKKYNNFFENFSENFLYQIELIPEEQFTENDVGDFFESHVYFSASPISRKKFFSSFTGAKLPLTSTPLCITPLANQTDIDLALNNMFTYNLKAHMFRVHRVGQGSCNSIIFKLQDNNKLFYDIGISKYSNKDPYYNVYVGRYSMFNMDKFNTIVISHWDEDHYMGIYLDACRKLLSKRWITPSIERNWLNIKRLVYLISIYGEIVMIDNSVRGHFYNKDDLFMFKGDGTGKNDAGIMICLKNEAMNLVAMGDVSYAHSGFVQSYSGGVFNQIDYLVVPHHGAFFTPGIIFTPKIPNCSTAIISVGYNTFGHPRSNTEIDLTTNGFKVLRTDKDERQLIEF